LQTTQLEVVRKQQLPSLLKLPQVLVLEEVPDRVQFHQLHQWFPQSQQIQSSQHLQSLLRFQVRRHLPQSNLLLPPSHQVQFRLNLLLRVLTQERIMVQAQQTEAPQSAQPVTTTRLLSHSIRLLAQKRLKL
jgi:hypothetical protein